MTTVFTEKVYASKYLKDFDVEQLKKFIYETGCTGCVEPRHIIYRINEQYHNNMGTYRCPAEQTSSGQDMSYWEKYRISVFEDYKRDALRNIIPHWIRLISNCKKLLVSDKYDMFEEFKRGYPHLSCYFDCKEFSWDIIGDSHDTNITTFIDCVVTCLLSKETENKQNEKIRKQQELRKKQEEEQKLLLYKKEFECAKLFDEIDKNKLKSSELYVEYKKITEIKDKGVLYNREFINYFTEDKKKYIRVLIELVTNPKPVSNEVKSTVTSEDVETIYRKGDACFFGRGVAQDYVEAARLYRLAAEQGHADAQYNLGCLFKNGQGVAQDDVEAMRWYRLAAEQGLAKAQVLLGLGFNYGRGVKQDYVEAARWFRLAAEQGNAHAQYLLGVKLSKGQGVKQDYVEAARWFRLAAEQGNVHAQFELGEMLLYGIGVIRDRAAAVRFYRLAAAQGDKEAQSRIALYESSVSLNPRPVKTPSDETAASSVVTNECPAAISPDCTIPPPPPPPYNYIDSSVIFDSKNDENLIIRVSECNADSSFIFDSNNDENIAIEGSECNAINIVVPQHPEGLGDAPPELPVKKKRGRPSYKSLLLNLDKNTMRSKSVASK